MYKKSRMTKQINVTTLFRVMVAGLTISFLGSLPLGTMNIAATHISIQQGTGAGLIYATGSMIVEITLVRIMLPGMGWLAKSHKIFRGLELFTVGLMAALAISCFIAAYQMKGFAGTLPGRIISPFWSGVFLSITNPLHIPFWMGWSTVLMEKRILIPRAGLYNSYIAGIGAGTLLGFSVFIFGGNYLVSQISKHQDLLNWAVGIILLITAGIQIKKISSSPASERYGKMTRSV
jgi:threonine/homoserine/homoserine lactone efflux protein